MYIHERISALLSEKGLNQKQLANATGISASTISEWKKKNTNPSADAIIHISEFLEVTADYLLTGKIRADAPTSLEQFTYNEQKLLDTFQQLNEANQHFILSKTIYQLGRQKRSEQWDREHPGAVEELLKKSFSTESIPPSDNVAYVNFESDLPADRKDIAVFFQPAAAGTGTFLDSDDYDMVDVPLDPVTIRASFGVKVSGDSMEPDFENEDIVFVKQQPDLENGEIGIFILNGDAYIKKLSKSEKSMTLISLNPKYEPLHVKKRDDFRVVGKVIGKLEE